MTSNTAEPVRLAASHSPSSTCAWIVTSSPEVGSSAISSFGRAESAIAITTRCAMPVESSCT